MPEAGRQCITASLTIGLDGPTAHRKGQPLCDPAEHLAFVASVHSWPVHSALQLRVRPFSLTGPLHYTRDIHPLLWIIC